MTRSRPLFLIPLIITLFQISSFPFYSGLTFEDRKQAFINDQGKRWGHNVSISHMPVFAWLETALEAKRQGLPSSQWDSWKPYSVTDEATGTVKQRSELISEAIQYLTNQGWWTGALPGSLPVPRIYYQYYHDPATRVVINPADIQELERRMSEMGVSMVNGAASNVWCAVANWNFPGIVNAYLYNAKVHNHGPVTYPPADPTYHCPPPFSYNGNSYVGNNSYDAKTILRDYLEFMMDDWLQHGTDEDLSPADYYRYQIHSIALLVDFAPDGHIRNKAKMLLDWMVFHYGIGISANHLAGGHGRHYDNFEWGGQDSYPVGIYFNLNPDPMTRWYSNTDPYVSSYRPPKFAAEFFESINGSARTESDSYYRILRGHVGALGDRYDYITANYNLGGTKFGTGWELNVKASGKPLKIFYCNGVPLSKDKACMSEPFTGTSLRYLLKLGENGSQVRNALFFKSNQGYIHEVLEGNTWDEQSNESGWEFRRKGNVAVAMLIGPDDGALEVVTIGVEYASYNDFKNAVKSNAVLTSGQFKTSEGRLIRDGDVDYGPEFTKLPFDRLEVWEGHVGQSDEKKVVDWNSNIMTVNKNSQLYSYDYNQWIYTGGGYNPGPVITIIAAPVSGTTPLSVAFQGSATDNDGIDSSSWLWYFDDGSSAAGQNSVHTYPKGGSYDVKLSVKDLKGNASEKTVTISVQDLNTNLARGRPVKVSSVEENLNWLSGSNAVDGDINTRWASQYNDNEWIEVDLGMNHELSKVVLNWQNAYGKKYQIQVSDNALDWLTIYDQPAGRGGVEELSVQGKGRYIRMLGVERGYLPYGYSLWEFEVYGVSSLKVQQRGNFHELSQVLRVFPNPATFNTQISFALEQSERAVLEVFDASGKSVGRLINRLMGSGTHHFVWEAQGNPAGLYFVRLTRGHEVLTSRIILLK